MLDIQPHPRGAVLPVRAHAGARRDEIVEVRSGALRVAVTAAPEQGKANDAIVHLLARELGLRRSQFTLLVGASSRTKAFLVEGVPPAELRSRIDGVLESTLYEPPGPVLDDGDPTEV
jgi:uncharacterized protein YggU (UPF0235/DUF167 family)